jgi:hypothetical protein
MLPRTISPSTGLARRLGSAKDAAAAEERAFERSVAMPPPPSIALYPAYGLRQRTRCFVRRLAKTASMRLVLDA